MFTQCRGCGEIFKIEVDDLVSASAMVRCSTCGAVFNALDTLSEYKPQQSSHLILHENDNSPPLLTHEFKKSIVKPKSVTKKSSSDKLTSNNSTIEEFDESFEYIVKPDFVADSPEKKSKTSKFIWVVATLTLIAMFLWQAVLALKNGSLELPDGIVKQEICSKIECYQKIKQTSFDNIAIVSRNIRQHGGRDNALIITSGMINSDDKTRTFPALQVKMSNLNGEIVAMRRFLPQEYVDKETLQAGMIPNILIPIQLELKSPGKNAVTFEVGFSPLYDAQY